MSPPRGDTWRPPREPSQMRNGQRPKPRPPMRSQQNQGDYKPRGGQFTFRYPKPPGISDRPLLTQGREASPEAVFGGGDNAPKFRSIDDLTDSEEEDMDQSASDDDHPPAKKQRTEARWSNPDPYTALPPDELIQGKKVDVVKLIRKARVSGAGLKSAAESSQAEDFISLGDIELPAIPDSQENGPGLKRKRDQAKNGTLVASHDKGMILPEFNINDPANAAPWFQPPTSQTQLAGASLHREIIDFYEWVRPRDFEHVVRRDLVVRLETLLCGGRFGWKLECFGSFATGLYLPTGDMDLVLMAPVPDSRRLLSTIGSKLRQSSMMVPGSFNAIRFAKVPIVKFTDARTGLRVDICVNNPSGLTAIATFETWKVEYPALPILVSVVKHFLMIRGLNDNATGGLGGFSIICLLTSFLQLYPSTDKIANLGQLLLYFFHLYGHVFNKRDLAIRLDPPGYTKKSDYPHVLSRAKFPDRLAIIDPNQADNNISGGSGEVNLIFSCFRQAFQDLKSEMSKRETSAPPTSLLVRLLGGDLSSYREQREQLQQVYDAQYQAPGTTYVSQGPGTYQR